MLVGLASKPYIQSNGSNWEDWNNSQGRLCWFDMYTVPQGQHMGVEAAHVVRVVLEALGREKVDPFGCRAPLALRLQGGLLPQVACDKEP